MERKKLLAIVVAVVVVAVAAGGVAAFFLAPAPPRTLVVGTTDKVITFDPADSYDYFSINVIQNTMASLLAYEAGTTTLKPDILSEVPTLANGGISSDGKNYTLKIRQGTKFEDGTIINASVVKYSIDRVVSLQGEPSFLLEPIKGAPEYWKAVADLAEKKATQEQVDSAWDNYTTQGVKIVDEYRVKITLGRAFSPFDTLLAFSVTTPVNPESFAFDRLYPDTIVASGQYVLRKYIPNVRIELEKNPLYYGTPPKMDRVTIIMYATATDLRLAIETGAIDVAYRTFLPTDYEALKKKAGLVSTEGDSPVIRYAVFNLNPNHVKNSTFADPNNGTHLRKAIAYAMDRDRINSDVFLNTTRSLYSLIPAGMFAHKDAFLEKYGPRNITKAREHLTLAGYSVANPFRFTLWFTPTHYGDTEDEVASVIKSSLEATGMISVTLSSKEWADYRSSWRAGAFGMFLLGWYPDYFDSDNYVFPFLHSDASWSFGNWYSNATVDQWLEDEAATADPQQRTTLFGQIQDQLAEDVPYLPLWQGKQQVVYKQGVSGIILDPLQIFRYYTISVG